MLKLISKLSILMLCSVSALASNQIAPVKPVADVSAIGDQFVSRLRDSFALKMNLPVESFDVRAENLVLYPEVPAEFAAKIAVLDVMGLGSTGAARIDGLFTMSMNLRYPDQSVHEHRISGLLHVSGPVWVARQSINRGRVVESSDLEMTRLPWSQLATGVALTRQDELLGRASRNFVQAGTPVYGAFLEIAPSVKLGDLVELTVQSGPGVLIRSRAIAKQAGRIGDTIRVEQSDTRKPMQVLVTGDKSVEVQL